MKLTKTDLAILKLLQANAWASNDEIGAAVGKSGSVVSRRVSELTKAGVITGAHVAVSGIKAGLPTTVFTLVTLKQHGDGMTEKFEREIEAMPHVTQLARIGGSWDYLLQFTVRDTPHYDQLHHKLLALPMVARVRGMHAIGVPVARRLPLE